MGVENHRHQHAVGQGGFHAGALHEGSELRLSYVYDCGAMDSYSGPREREIRHYLKRACRKRPLDLLFLSHVHADHVNGLPQLLDRSAGGIDVDTIVLPLLDPAERLIAFGRTAAEDRASAQSEFYQAFVTDPAAALGRFRPRQILFVRRAPEGGGAPGSDGDDLGTPDGPGIVGPKSDKGPCWELVGTGSVDELTVGERVQGARQFLIDDTTALAVRTRGGAWLLAPFVDPVILAARRQFLNELARECRVPRHDIETWLGETAHVQELVTMRLHKLAAAYASVTRDLNLTSICLYSGPARGMSRSLPRTRLGIFGCVWASDDRPAWLATGDAALKQAPRRRAMLDHYRALLAEVGTLVLPHHGSDHNFDAQLLRAVRPATCVVAADKYGNWKHPGPHVVQAVCSLPAVLQVVTSARGSKVHENGRLG